MLAFRSRGRRSSGRRPRRSRLKGSALCLLLILLFAGCVYESEVTRRESSGARLNSPDSDRYGVLQFVWVREYRAPWGVFKFPDGGKPLELALYATVMQVGKGVKREVGRIELEPVRRGDFGNLNDAEYRWLQPDRLGVRVEYGYTGMLERVTASELVIPPLVPPE